MQQKYRKLLGNLGNAAEAACGYDDPDLPALYTSPARTSTRGPPTSAPDRPDPSRKRRLPPGTRRFCVSRIDRKERRIRGVFPSQVAAADGRPMDVHSSGDGPGVVVVHGSAVSAKDYRRLADALADRFTVHLYDRRGRGARGPVEATHGVASDVDDLRAVLDHTGARVVLAHSYGGLVALQGAPTLPIDRLAVFDAAVSIDGGFPSAYVEPFVRAVAEDDFPHAMAVLSKGLESIGPLSRLPIPVLAAMARVFAVTPLGREWQTMVPSAVVEAQEVLAHDGPASTYAGVTTDVLLVNGGSSPAYFARASAALAGALPNARHHVISKANHNAINVASAPFVAQFAGFLDGSG